MYDDAAAIIRDSENIVFFTGAGISTESGIPDFRSSSGLYTENDYLGYPPEMILSKKFFDARPDIFYKYYFEKIIHRYARPNRGHKAMAGFEGRKNVSVVTQNIDGLHQAAGSGNVVELHGSVHANRCMNCGEEFSLDYVLGFCPGIPVCCACGFTVRPAVTMYGERLDETAYLKAEGLVKDAEVLIVAGSSLTVYPAAGLIDFFRGKAMIIVNRTQTGYDAKAKFVIRDECGDALERLASRSLND
ncbi:MAG: NAD-dependent protein deacylase [Clostridia bacterium]|nr:NAD-dependent protein deacylase [Clostridia bacterium]